MATSTTNFGLSKPAVNSATDQDQWGTELNTDLDNIDTIFKASLNWVYTAKAASFLIVAPTAASATIADAKKLFVCDATGGAIVPTLPAAASSTNMVVGIKKTDASANAVTITANAAELIDGANTLVLSNRYNWAILVCDGTGWQIISQSGGNALTLISTATASVVATVDITSGITSAYAHYIIEVSNLIAASASQNFTCLFYQGGAFVTSANYEFNYTGNGSNNTPLTGSGEAQTAIQIDGVAAGSTTVPSSYIFHLFQPNLTTGTSIFWNGTKACSTPRSYSIVGSGYLNLSAATTGIRFLMSSGNITSATVKLYGVN